MPPSLTDQIVAGAAWVIALRAATRVLGLVSLMVLARILVPADYGLVALAGVFAGAIQLLSSFNFEIWLIRHSAAKPPHYNTVWTLSIIRGVVTALILLAVAHPVARLFDEPRLTAILSVLALGHALRGFQNVGVIEFQKDLAFDKDSILIGISKLIGFAAAVVVAFTLRSYWALVAGMLMEQVARVAMSYTMHRYRPVLSLACWHEAFDFSKWLLVSNVLGFVYRRGDTLIIGKLVSSQLLGFYTVAREIGNLTSTEVIMPIRRVMLPAYSKFADDPTRIRQAFLDGLGFIALFGVPAAVGIGLTADPLVRVVLGEKWLEAIPLLRIMALYGLAAVGLANQGPLLLALGRTRLYSNLNAIAVGILLPSLWFATERFGVTGGAWAASLTNLCFFAVTLIATSRVTGTAAGAVVGVLWRTLAATAVMACVVIAIGRALANSDVNALLQLAGCVAGGAMSFALAVAALWAASGRRAGPERIVTAFLQRRFGLRDTD